MPDAWQAAAISVEGSNGKILKRVCEVAGAWLRKDAKEDAKALRALSYPTGAEEAKLKKAK